VWQGKELQRVRISRLAQLCAIAQGQNTHARCGWEKEVKGWIPKRKKKYIWWITESQFSFSGPFHLFVHANKYKIFMNEHV